MKQIVRLNTFETNSSSVHSICMCSNKEFEDFKKGKLIFDNGIDKLVPIDSIQKDFEDYVPEYLKENDLDELTEDDKEYALQQFYNEYDYRTYENLGGECYESFEDSYTTENGDTVIAFGYYGNGY